MMSTATKIRLITTTSLTLAGLLCSAAAQAQEALPAGGRVVRGEATIGAPSGTRQTITQTSKRAVIDWRSFDVGEPNSLDFVQPDAGAATLNRVTGDTGSRIAGQITATGSVYLINPNGIQITESGVINAGRGFVASTLDVGNDSFMAGGGSFAGTGGLIDHRGTIAVGTGGVVGLLGGEVRSSGLIAAPAGKVVIGAVSRATLDLNGGGFLQVALPAAATTSTDGSTALVTSDAAYRAARGVVNTDALSAQSVSAAGGVITLGGRVSVDSTVGDTGSIMVMGDHTRVDGVLTARALGPTGNGGFIETSGNTVKLGGITVDTSAVGGETGIWLIDPTDLTIAAQDGDMTGTAISDNLATSNVTIRSTEGGTEGNGDIFVNDDISWSNGNRLTLSAYRNIEVNAGITGTGAGASLVLRADDTGTGNGTVTMGSGTVDLSGANSAVDIYYNLASYAAPSDYSATVTAGRLDAWMLVNTLDNLQAIDDNLGGSYALGRDIDASASAGLNGGAGFDPIGSNANRFTGTFDGQGHVITGLTIDRPAEDNVGLFAVTTGTIQNVGLEGGTVTGRDSVGGLAGATAGTITQSYNAGAVNGGNQVGGLVGYGNADSEVSQSYATGAVKGTISVGGLRGWSSGTVTQSYATGAVKGNELVGGLVGQFRGTVTQSYATGAANGTTGVGGLVGAGLTGSEVSQSYAIGAVHGQDLVGGLMGSSNGTVTQSYATGAVQGTDNFGGLVGLNLGSGSISNSYWDSYSTGQGNAVGLNWGDISNVVSVSSDPADAAAPHYAFDASAYANFDVADWVFVDGARPFGAWEMPGAVGGVTTIVNSHQLQLIGANGASLASDYMLGRDIDLAETGAIVACTAAASCAPGDYAGMWAATGFDPIGSNANRFTGTFDGQGHVIAGLTIDRSGEDDVGLFAVTNGTIQNVGLEGGTVTGRDRVGGLVGATAGKITQSYNSGTVNGGNQVGGLVGYANADSDVSQSYATGAVSGFGHVGGLVGYSAGTVTQSYAMGAVSGFGQVGGLLGMSQGMVKQSHASGAVKGRGQVGGLVGWTDDTVRQSYATGAVSGTEQVGGLAGGSNGTVDRSYATGAVSGHLVVGGLIGYLNTKASINNSYWDSHSTGRIHPVGYNAGIVSNVTAVSSNPADAAAANYAFNPTAWSNFTTTGVSDIDTVGGQALTWRMYAGHTMPLLKAFMAPAVVDTGSVNSVYDGTVQAGSNGYTLAPDLDPALVLGSLDGAGGTDAGSYSIGIGGLYSTQQGYDLVPGTLGSFTIDRRTLNLVYTADPASISYGDTPAGLSGSYTAEGLVEGETLNGTAAWTTDADSTSAAGSYAIEGTGLSASDNYVLEATQAESNATALTITEKSDSHTYDGLRRILRRLIRLLRYLRHW